MSIRMRLREERAQATVEMAVVTPVLLVLALIRVQRHDLCRRCRALRRVGARRSWP